MASKLLPSLIMNLTQEQKFTLIGLGLAIVIGVSVYAYNHLIDPQKPDLLVEGGLRLPIERSQIVVHISGEVCRPGVYRVNRGDRVLDAVKLAGGRTAFGDLDIVNLAEVLKDGQKMEIPSRYGREQMEEQKGEDAKKKKKPKTKKGKEEKAGVKAVFPININTAKAEQLEALPKIGPSTAEKIIEYRKAHGAFTKPEDLKKVPRIGDKTFEKLKDKIVL